MKHLLPIAAISLLTLAGCTNTSQYSGDVYRGNEAKTAQSFELGTIAATRIVKIQADSRTGNLLGGGGGAIIGGLLGSQVGGGSGRQIATAVGALGGAVAGTAAEDGINRIDAWELEIRTDSGRDIIVVQRADRPFEAGQRVRIVGSGNDVRVVPY